MIKGRKQSSGSSSRTRREHKESMRGTQAVKHKGDEELREATELLSGHILWNRGPKEFARRRRAGSE